MHWVKELKMENRKLRKKVEKLKEIKQSLREKNQKLIEKNQNVKGELEAKRELINEQAQTHRKLAEDFAIQKNFNTNLVKGFLMLERLLGELSEEQITKFQKTDDFKFVKKLMEKLK